MYDWLCTNTYTNILQFWTIHSVYYTHQGSFSFNLFTLRLRLLLLKLLPSTLSSCCKKSMKIQKIPIHAQQLLQKIQENLHSLKSCCKKIHKSTKIQKIPIRAQQLLQKKYMEIQKSRITESQLLLLHITTKVTELVSTQVILLEFYSIAIWWISNIFHCCKRKPVEFVTSVGLSNLVELNNFVQICEREPVELVSRVGSCSKMASYLSLSSHLVARTCFQNRLLQYLYSWVVLMNMYLYILWHDLIQDTDIHIFFP